jgi:hypothetical protein
MGIAVCTTSRILCGDDSSEIPSCFARAITGQYIKHDASTNSTEIRIQPKACGEDSSAEAHYLVRRAT